MHDWAHHEDGSNVGSWWISIMGTVALYSPNDYTTTTSFLDRPREADG